MFTKGSQPPSDKPARKPCKARSSAASGLPDPAAHARRANGRTTDAASTTMRPRRTLRTWSYVSPRRDDGGSSIVVSVRVRNENHAIGWEALRLARSLNWPFDVHG